MDQHQQEQSVLSPLLEGEVNIYDESPQQSIVPSQVIGDPDVDVWVASSHRVRGRSYSESFVMRSVLEHKSGKPIRWMAVAFITYFNVCGGPWGAEEIVSSVGPFYGLLGLVLFCFMWGLPLVLITAELSSTYADDGGYSIWVAEAFGPFWGFQEAYWSWLSGVIDTAIYPVLTYDTAIQIIDGDWGKPIDDETGVCEASNSTLLLSSTHHGNPTWIQAYSIKLGLAILFALPNFFTVKAFGRGLTMLALFVMLPFLYQSIYVLVAVEKDFSVLTETKKDASYSDWAQLVSVLYWNLSGFDAISTCAGEVHDPGRSYPKGLFLALFLVFVSYALPLVSFTAANNPDWSCWEEGWFSVIAQEEVGKGMALWIVIASVAGNSGMYSAEVFEDSWQLCGMAKTGLVPRLFATRWGSDGSPYVAILFALFVIAGLIALDFNAIVCITNLFSVLSAMLEVLAFLKLRLVEPNLYRPFRIPIENISLLTMYLLSPFLLGITILLSSLFTNLLSVGINAFALLMGFATFHYMKRGGHITYHYNNNR